MKIKYETGQADRHQVDIEVEQEHVPREGETVVLVTDIEMTFRVHRVSWILDLEAGTQHVNVLLRA